ncbi:MAG TPA: DUF4340 domain-containing protein, partial [Candidatus Dormibacteraeota bacterium]|nr:DUF4340 domain-containing protein [Candidatus Dormibacteraeota bacterium]
TEVGLSKGDGTRTTLKRTASEWQVAERGWPADTTKVRKLLLDLGALNIVEEKTRLPANYPQLGVEDVNSPKAGGTRVALSGAGKSWALIVGKSSSAKSGYVRVASAPQTLLAAPLLSVDADPKSWLERTILDIPAERVRHVEEHPPEGAAFSLAKEKKEQSNFGVTPLPKGRELSAPGAADAIAGGLAALTLEDVAKAQATDGKSTGATSPAADNADPKGADAKGADAKGADGKGSAGKTAESKPARALFQTFDGLEIEVNGHKNGTRALISVSAHAGGKEAEAEAQKLQARLAGWEFDIPEYKYNTLFRPLEELLKKPPEPPKKPTKAAAKSSAPKAAAPESPAPEPPPAH